MYYLVYSPALYRFPPSSLYFLSYLFIFLFRVRFRVVSFFRVQQGAVMEKMGDILLLV